MKCCFVGLVAILLARCAPAAERLNWVQQPKLTFDGQEQIWRVTFELSAVCDVEVAMVDPKSSTVIRHLAAGVLGKNAPPPLVVNSCAQNIDWDGKDDYGESVPEAADVAVRVRAGMTVSLERIVGGDPYAFYSEEMGDSDHSPWGIYGLEAKPDGKVYVWGHSSNLGPPALRQYDIDGNYLKTHFPMPAGKDAHAMTGWGINVKRSLSLYHARGKPKTISKICV